MKSKKKNDNLLLSFVWVENSHILEKSAKIFYKMREEVDLEMAKHKLSSRNQSSNTNSFIPIVSRKKQISIREISNLHFLCTRYQLVSHKEDVREMNEVIFFIFFMACCCHFMFYPFHECENIFTKHIENCLEIFHKTFLFPFSAELSVFLLYADV